MQRHFGDVDRASRRRALEDHFFHLGAAKQPRALFAEHPPHGVGDVRLSATVRSDDRRDARVEHQLGGVSERFETLKLELGQPH